MKLAIIGDIHNGEDQGTKNGQAAPELLSMFLKFCDEKRPDRIIELGDRINNENPETDRKSLETVVQIFSKSQHPVSHVMGNHDVHYLSLEDNERILNCSLSSHVVKVEDFNLIIWNPNVHMDDVQGLCLDQQDFEWLEEALSKIEYPAILFSHVPLLKGSMRGNYYFDENAGYSHQAAYPQEQAHMVQKILETSDKVVACINGHTHWNAYHCCDGIHYITIPSLTERFMTYPKPNAAWAWLEASSQKIALEVFGETPIQYILPLKDKNHHWKTP